MDTRFLQRGKGLVAPAYADRVLSLALATSPSRAKNVITLYGRGGPESGLLHTALGTWFHVPSDDVGLVTMGSDKPLCAVQHSPAGAHTLATTSAALALPMVEFPMARWFVRFEEGSYVYKRELVAQLEGLQAD
jgi:hypothetical protein